jgi:hypothetical protein
MQNTYQAVTATDPRNAVKRPQRATAAVVLANETTG